MSKILSQEEIDALLSGEGVGGDLGGEMAPESGGMTTKKKSWSASTISSIPTA